MTTITEYFGEVLKPTQFNKVSSGTLATKVKCYTDGNILVSIDYILKDDPDHDSLVDDCQQVSFGYVTDTTNVRRR